MPRMQNKTAKIPVIDKSIPLKIKSSSKSKIPKLKNPQIHIKHTCNDKTKSLYVTEENTEPVLHMTITEVSIRKKPSEINTESGFDEVVDLIKKMSGLCNKIATFEASVASAREESHVSCNPEAGDCETNLPRTNYDITPCLNTLSNCPSAASSQHKLNRNKNINSQMNNPLMLKKCSSSKECKEMQNARSQYSSYPTEIIKDSKEICTLDLSCRLCESVCVDVDIPQSLNVINDMRALNDQTDSLIERIANLENQCAKNTCCSVALEEIQRQKEVIRDMVENLQQHTNKLIDMSEDLNCIQNQMQILAEQIQYLSEKKVVCTHSSQRFGHNNISSLLSDVTTDRAIETTPLCLPPTTNSPSLDGKDDQSDLISHFSLNSNVPVPCYNSEPCVSRNCTASLATTDTTANNYIIKKLKHSFPSVYNSIMRHVRKENHLAKTVKVDSVKNVTKCKSPPGLKTCRHLYEEKKNMEIKPTNSQSCKEQLVSGGHDLLYYNSTYHALLSSRDSKDSCISKEVTRKKSIPQSKGSVTNSRNSRSLKTEDRQPTLRMSPKNVRSNTAKKATYTEILNPRFGRSNQLASLKTDAEEPAQHLKNWCNASNIKLRKSLYSMRPCNIRREEFRIPEKDADDINVLSNISKTEISSKSKSLSLCNSPSNQINSENGNVETIFNYDGFSSTSSNEQPERGTKYVLCKCARSYDIIRLQEMGLQPVKLQHVGAADEDTKPFLQELTTLTEIDTTAKALNTPEFPLENSNSSNENKSKQKSEASGETGFEKAVADKRKSGVSNVFRNLFRRENKK